MIQWSKGKWFNDLMSKWFNDLMNNDSTIQGKVIHWSNEKWFNDLMKSTDGIILFTGSINGLIGKLFNKGKFCHHVFS